MEIKEILKKMSHDFRGEVLAKELVERYKLNSDNVCLVPEGHFKRAFQKDISGIELEEKAGRVSRVVIRLNRDGLYDALPEGLFHQPIHTRANPFKTVEEMAKETKRIRKEEQEARKFFSVFESAINQLRISLEETERRIIPGLANCEKEHLLFEQLWGNYPALTEDQKVSLFYLLPVANRISGNAGDLTLCFEILLNEKVRVEYVRPKVQYSEIKNKALGEMHLALDSIVGTQFDDGIRDVQISIGPLGEGDLLNYLPFGKKFEVLKIFYNYFIPAECDITTEILIKEEIKEVKLTETEDVGRLGYSSYLATEI